MEWRERKKAERKSRIGAWKGGLIGALCLVALTALPAPARNGCEADLNVSFENELIALVNAQRRKSGLKPLTPQAQLKAVARAHSTDMACNGLFSHTGRDGSSIRDRVAAREYRFLAIGENIAVGYETPQDVLAEWMSSPRHRKNILTPSFTEVGAGHASLPKSKYHNYWTAVFGSPLLRK
jgi:uncharacterized protein YkwD